MKYQCMKIEWHLTDNTCTFEQDQSSSLPEHERPEISPQPGSALTCGSFHGRQGNCRRAELDRVRDTCFRSRSSCFSKALAFAAIGLKLHDSSLRGRPGFDGDDEAKVAGRGAGRSSSKPSRNIIANDNYDYAMAA